MQGIGTDGGVWRWGGEGGSARVIIEAIFMTRLPKHHLHIERPVGWTRLGTRRASGRNLGRRCRNLTLKKFERKLISFLWRGVTSMTCQVLRLMILSENFLSLTACLTMSLLCPSLSSLSSPCPPATLSARCDLVTSTSRLQWSWPLTLTASQFESPR
ncbi:hypothetical protein E2C01_000883 [Portunus trituberculatus]|uniref:Uncharacterized protein n=1 Tax=Portunus trituberculatus TaxID=210409 RepID=A0A5B7CFA3_PORTR|nr:hypothetical protein [Portunus trituberculatus]